MSNFPFSSIFLMILLIVYLNMGLFTKYENVYELKEKFLANDSTKIVFASLDNFVVSEYDGKVVYTDGVSEYFKFKNAIEKNDTIYVYTTYKGLIPIINWPLVPIGEYISTEIKE